VSEWLGWRLRNPAHPDRPITLRLLLSHRSSLQDEVDYAVPLGTSLRERASQAAAFDPSHPPGTFFRYSNLNFPVIASVMERATGERFDRLMARLVLQPLGLDACFNWTTCSDAAMARAVVLYAPDGSVVRDDLQGRRPACAVNAPAGSECRLDDYVLGSNGALFSPQGGLRISIRGLTRVGRLLLRRPETRPGPFVSDAALRAMLSPQWTFDGSNGAIDDGFYCSYGLAVQVLATPAAGCRDDLFGDGRRLVGHAGDAYGLRSGLWVDRERGVGIAYLATSLGDDPARGERTAYRAIEEWLAARLADAPRR
jgi:CubicO group peptidase (beta-lactamase class C family)